MAEKDMMGIERQEAENRLDQFLHETLQEPGAKLSGVQLVDGRWQSHVDGSERGIRVVFLKEHGGKVVPGHMTQDAHPETPLKNW